MRLHVDPQAKEHTPTPFPPHLPQVKEYREPSAESGDMTEEQVKQLERDVSARRSMLEQWSRTAFDEAFSCWVHLMTIRLFVESILRYGLPPAYQAAVVIPENKVCWGDTWVACSFVVVRAHAGHGLCA